jgi:phage gpG-like protein
MGSQRLIEVDFGVEGDTEVIAMLNAASVRSKTLRRPFRLIGEYFEEQIDKNFGGRGSIWGKWKRRQRAPKDGHPLLEDSGKMRDNFKKKVGNTYVEIRNDSKQFPFHQSKKPRKTRLPRRVMMAVEKEQLTESMKILQKHVIEGK